MQDDRVGIIKSVGEFIANLTPKSLILGVMGAFFALCLYSLYENRLVAFPYILNSPTLLWGIGITIAVLSLTWATVLSVRRVEEMFENRIAEQQLRIDDQQKHIDILRADLEGCKVDCREANQGLLKQILEKLNHGP